MCDPIVLPLALSAAGVAAKQMGASKAASARNDVLAAERTRQNALDQEAAALNTQSQDRYQGFKPQQDEKSKELGDYFKGQQIEADAAANAGAPMLPQSSSNITVQNETAERGKARAATDDLAAKRGDLRAFGDLVGGIGRLQARDAGKIGQIGNFKKSSSDVSALELDSASGAGNGWNMIGDLAGALGSVGTAAALKGDWVKPANPMASMAAGRAADRASMPGYAASSGGGGLFDGLKSLFGVFG